MSTFAAAAASSAARAAAFDEMFASRTAAIAAHVAAQAALPVMSDEKWIPFERAAFKEAEQVTLRIVATDRTVAETRAFQTRFRQDILWDVDRLRDENTGYVSPVNGFVLRYVFGVVFDEALRRMNPGYTRSDQGRNSFVFDYWQHVMAIRHSRPVPLDRDDKEGSIQKSVNLLRNVLVVGMPRIHQQIQIEESRAQKIKRHQQHLLMALDLHTGLTMIDAKYDARDENGEAYRDSKWETAKPLLQQRLDELQAASDARKEDHRAAEMYRPAQVQRALERRPGMNDLVYDLIAGMVSSHIDPAVRPFVSSNPATRARSNLNEAVQSFQFVSSENTIVAVRDIVRDLISAGGNLHMEAARMLHQLTTQHYDRGVIYATLVEVKLYLTGE